MKSIIYIIAALLWLQTGFSQETSIDKVLLIGDEDQYYENLVGSCDKMLLTVSDNSMNIAFEHWTSLLSSMETAAEDADFDLKGIKMWVNVFWNADGSIKNIFYYPKPNSKNMDFEKLTYFMEAFAADFILPIDSNTCFSHYGSASFPIRSRVNRDAK